MPRDLRVLCKEPCSKTKERKMLLVLYHLGDYQGPVLCQELVAETKCIYFSCFTGRHDKASHTRWLKTTEMYCLRVLKGLRPKARYQQSHAPSKTDDPGDPSLPRLLRASGGLLGIPGTSRLQLQHLSLCLRLQSLHLVFSPPRCLCLMLTDYSYKDTVPK